MTFHGYHAEQPDRVLSSGSTVLTTSADPVGAPIFYRDVPLMPAETERGVIKPLAQNAVPLIAWRLRDIGQESSRVMLRDMPTCANCHSFSKDGSTMGMDVVEQMAALGIRNLFVQPGAGSKELSSRCEELGIAVHEGCVLVELPAGRL